MRGTSKTMTGLKVRDAKQSWKCLCCKINYFLYCGTQEYDDVVAEVGEVLNERAAAAETAGIFRWNIILDPGIGFAKARVLNLKLLRKLSTVKRVCHGLPLLVSEAFTLSGRARRWC